jgi:hypothetical protein
MIFQECPPVLSSFHEVITFAGWLRHEARHSALRDAEAKFDQFAMNARSSPSGIFVSHLPYRGDAFRACVPAPAFARFPFPEKAEPITMPTNHS